MAKQTNTGQMFCQSQSGIYQDFHYNCQQNRVPPCLKGKGKTHSDKVVKQQSKFLRMEELNQIAEKRFGKIAGKYVIYRGKTQDVDGIKYVNVEEYLNNLAV